MLGFVHLVDGQPSPHAAPIVGPVAVSAKGGWLLRRAAQRPVMARGRLPFGGIWQNFAIFCVAVRAAKSGCEVLAELGPGLVVAADCGGGCLAEATSRAQVLNLMHSVLRPA